MKSNQLFACASIVATGLFSACSDAERPELVGTTTEQPTATTGQPQVSSIQTCTDAGVAPWEPLPDFFDPESIAAVLDVEPARVMAGLFGTAACKQALTYEQIINDENTVIAVESIGLDCLILGTAGEEAPVPGRQYTEFLVACATEPI